MNQSLIQSRVFKGIISVIAFFTLCGLTWGVYILFTGKTLTYFQYSRQAETLNGETIGVVKCKNGYTWRVRNFAQAEPSSFERGSAELRVQRVLELADPNDHVVSQGGSGRGNIEITSSLETLKPFEQAFVFTDVVEQMKAWSRPDYHSTMGPKRWSFILVPPDKVSPDDFRDVAQCLADSYPMINAPFTADVTERRSSSGFDNLPLGGLYLMDPQSQRSGVTYKCGEGDAVDVYGETVRISKKRGQMGDDVIGVVGIDGVMRPSITQRYTGMDGEATYHVLPESEAHFQQFRDLERIVKEQECVSSGKKLSDIMQSMPQRVEVIVPLY